MILAGDIGGTKTALGLFCPSAADLFCPSAVDLELKRYAEFPSRDFPSLEAVVVRFLQDEQPPLPDTACFGVAGPVIAGQSRLTNLPWRLDEKSLAENLRGVMSAAQGVGAPRVRLVNDLEATAVGMLRLPPEDFCVLNEGEQPPEPRNIAVIAAGTGLGEAFLFWDGRRYLPSATEGGHTDFAPRGAEQLDLLRCMQLELGGRVSCERVLSGLGLVNLYRYFRDGAAGLKPGWLSPDNGDGGAVATAASSGADAAAVKAMEAFVDIYGAEAGDQALKVLSLSGVYIAGGIAPKLLSRLSDGRFMKAFTDKGRFSAMMQRIPVKVALNPRAGMIGAAWMALDA
jgi:glucokinase